MFLKIQTDNLSSMLFLSNQSSLLLREMKLLKKHSPSRTFCENSSKRESSFSGIHLTKLSYAGAYKSSWCFGGHWKGCRLQVELRQRRTFGREGVPAMEITDGLRSGELKVPGGLSYRLERYACSHLVKKIFLTLECEKVFIAMSVSWGV